MARGRRRNLPSPPQVAALSEPAGYFDTDNLISNERSYLDVVPDLKKRGVKGGAYIGVGPDQNFSYIAAIRPDVAFIVDVRRDNLLLHLLFKSLFTLARTRVEYLAMLLGRPVPADVESWRDAPLDKHRVARRGGARSTRARVTVLRGRVDEAIAKTGVPLSREDLATIDRFHRRFIEAGVGLRFQSTGRPPQSHYPTYRDLLLATDALGERSNYLASEESFQFIKIMQQRDLVDSRRRRSERPARARRDRHAPPPARPAPLGVLRLERRVLSLRRRTLRPLRRQPRRHAARRARASIIRSVFGRYARYGGGSSSHLQPVERARHGLREGPVPLLRRAHRRSTISARLRQGFGRSASSTDCLEP